MSVICASKLFRVDQKNEIGIISATSKPISVSQMFLFPC